MKAILLLLLLFGSLFANNCKLKVLKFDIDSSLHLTLESNKECKGYGVDLELKDGDKFTFYVNFRPKIVNQAPPFGFSLSNGKGYISLGVDKNIIDSKLDAKLLEDSKIESVKNSSITYWHIYLKELDSLKKITASGVEIKHMGQRECKMVYLNYLTQVRVKEPNVDMGRFINFCKSTWIIDNKDLLLNQLFKMTTKDLKNPKNRDILEFIKEKPIKKSTKNSCKVTVKLVHAISLQPISDSSFTYIVEKINNESYHKLYKKSSFELLRGSYGISVVGDRFSGQSRLINCEGGDFYVTIPLFPHI